MIIDILEVGEYLANCYLVGCEKTRAGIVIDPGDAGDFVISKIKQNKLRIDKIVLTHGHLDHIGAVEYLRNILGAKVLIHSGDAEMLTSPERNLSAFTASPMAAKEPDILLEDGQIIEFGETALKVLHTPGHSPGGISLYGEGVVFTGDTLFLGSVGRTDLPNGDFDLLMSSIQGKLFALPDETIIYPGHGPETTVEQEKNFNPFVR
ncbi:MAG: MBL fold metallo-hydrolase [candidate division Zixibacteria bacterium CG_4_9_14_3_um_filter_46_8]|nr:MAG: MBL fold metallo-hydrolase [candidate division Zixibacteria bacterium CG_4_9_14_3_um_filter_46_8]